MTKIDVAMIKKLRDESGAPVIRVKKVLEEFGGDKSLTSDEVEKKALELLKKEGFEKAAKREGRATAQGKIFSYVHHSGKIGVLVEILCETDFVAKNELFEQLGKDFCLQITSVDPKNEKELLEGEFIKDPSKKMSDLVKEVIAKTGENVVLGKFARLQIGK